MSRFAASLLAFAFVLLAGREAPALTPTRYDMAASLVSVPASGGASLGPIFFFQTNDQVVFRLIPAGQTEANPAARWEFWSPTVGGRPVSPPAGYESLTVLGLGAGGGVIGKTSEPATPRNAALFWTAAGGSVVPTGFDPGASALETINAAGVTAGFSESDRYRLVSWNSRTPLLGTTEIVPPAGATSAKVISVNASGEVLLHLNDANGKARVAIGGAFIGPEPADGEFFYPANCAMNAGGDIAMLAFTPGGGSRLHYVPAANRATWQTFSFAGPVQSVYNLRVSNAGLASFDSGVNGGNFVNVVSPARAEQRTYAGYRSYLNSGGAFVFGNGGKLFQWDAAAWSGEPAEVPVSFATASGGLDVEGFNDDGRLLVVGTQQGTRTLAILAPAFPQPPVPSVVKLKPIRRLVRLRVGTRIRDRLVETTMSGDSITGRVRYRVRGRLPTGMKFRISEAILSGAPTRVQRRVLRVSATWSSGGVKQESAPVTIKVQVRAPASRPTQ